jgi:predicted TIM-barrel fold metal-dependent hydrolase
MDRAGVDAAMLVPLDSHDDYVAQAGGANPRRFAGVAVARDCDLGHGHDPAGRTGPAALLARHEVFPFAAVRTSWLGDPEQPVTSSSALSTFRHLADTGLVLSTYLPPDQLPLLKQLLDAVPHLQVLVNHLGFCPHHMMVDEHRRQRFDLPFPPSTTDEILQLADRPGAHIMVSGQYALSTEGPPHRDLHGWIQQLMGAFGPRRLAWASDFPWIKDVPGYSTTLELVSQTLPTLSQGDLDFVLGGTALSLFPALSPQRRDS